MCSAYLLKKEWMKCVSAWFFSFSPHIKCLSALIAGGKADIKIGWLRSFSAPFVTLPLEPNCMSTPCPPWCLPVGDRPQVTSLWPALVSKALIKLGWWMSTPLLGMSLWGCSGNMALTYFLGGIWCLKIRNMGNKELVRFCPCWKPRVSEMGFGQGFCSSPNTS